MFIEFLIVFVSILTKILYWAVFINVILSWVSRKKTPFSNMIDNLVKPILAPFRWAKIGMIDFSPILALVALSFLGNKLVEVLINIAV